ncbi:unnamed protein product, partial [Staurois parvus]
SSPCQLVHTALHGCAQHSHTNSVLTVKHKHTQHTVNPLIAPHVNPFLPSGISTVSVFFFLVLITVFVSLGMPVTPSQFPPSVRMPTAVPL